MAQRTGELTVMQKLRLEIQNYCGDQIFKDVYQDLFDKAIKDDIEQINDVYQRGKENAPLNLSLFFEVPDNKTYNIENSIEVKFWIELETTVDNMNEFTKSEDCRLVAEILKKYSIDATIRSEAKIKH